MAGVVRGIREVHQVTVSVEGPGVAVLRGEHVGLRRGPIITRRERVCVDLSDEAIARTVGRRIHHLAENSGAGPCGTLARGLCKRRTVDPNKFMGQRFVWTCPLPVMLSPSPLAWSIHHLVEPLAHYYATYEPPVRLGAKGTPRGRRAA